MKSYSLTFGTFLYITCTHISHFLYIKNRYIRTFLYITYVYRNTAAAIFRGKFSVEALTVGQCCQCDQTLYHTSTMQNKLSRKLSLLLLKLQNNCT